MSSNFKMFDSETGEQVRLEADAFALAEATIGLMEGS